MDRSKKILTWGRGVQKSEKRVDVFLNGSKESEKERIIIFHPPQIQKVVCKQRYTYFHVTHFKVMEFLTIEIETEE